MARFGQDDEFEEPHTSAVSASLRLPQNKGKQAILLRCGLNDLTPTSTCTGRPVLLLTLIKQFHHPSPFRSSNGASLYSHRSSNVHHFSVCQCPECPSGLALPLSSTPHLVIYASLAVVIVVVCEDAPSSVSWSDIGSK